MHLGLNATENTWTTESICHLHPQANIWISYCWVDFCMRRKGKHLWIRRDVHTKALQFLLPVLKKHENENIAGPERQMTSRKRDASPGKCATSCSYWLQTVSKVVSSVASSSPPAEAAWLFAVSFDAKVKPFSVMVRFLVYFPLKRLSACAVTGYLALGMVTSHWGVGRRHQNMGT